MKTRICGVYFMLLMTILIWFAYLFATYFLVYWLLLFIETEPRLRKEYNEKIVLKRHPFVSILVPAWNEENTVVKTLNSLITLDWPKNKLEIIVVDDGSKDRTAEVVKQFQKEHPKEPIKLLQQENKGKAAALNSGLKILKGEYFTCLDADSFVESDALNRMIYWHEKYPLVAITTPVMKIHKPRTVMQQFQKIEYISGMFLTKLMSYIDANYVAPGPFSTYKTKIIRDLGGFDEDNLVEDQEIAYRAQEKHYKIMQVPRAIVHTVGPKTFKAFRKQRNRWYKGTILNMWKYKHLMFKKEYGDFGVYQLPILNVFAFLLGLVAIGSFINYAIIPLIKLIHRFWLIRFNLLPYFQTMHFTFDFLSLPAASLFILGFSLILGIAFLLYSGKINKDSLRSYILYIIPFFFIYFLFIAYVVVLVIGELVLGKKQKW